MSQQETAIKDTIGDELTERGAVTAIMELYNVDESTARELWTRFLGTVEKLKNIAEAKEHSHEAKP